jgi:hypothetical protein
MKAMQKKIEIRVKPWPRHELKKGTRWLQGKPPAAYAGGGLVLTAY